MFYYLCENAYKALILIVSSNHQQVPVCFGGTQWSEVEDTYEQKHNKENEGQMSGLRKLQYEANYVIKEQLKKQMRRFVQCVKMPIFILSQGIFKQPASAYQSWQSSVDLSGVGSYFMTRTVACCMHLHSSYHMKSTKGKTRNT